jgi:hypothetical protein
LTALPTLKKLLSYSLPFGIATAFLAAGHMPEARGSTDASSVESPAELRLTALDTVMKGDKHTALDLYEEAIRLANRQFGSDSTFLGDLYYEAGRLYLELDQFNQAEDYLRQAVKINPKNASARLALARLLDTRAKVQESIGQIREALLINPSSPVARQKFVQTLSKYGQSPSDKAIVTQESFTLAMMQKASRDALQKPLANQANKPERKAGGPASSKKAAAGEGLHALTVPTLPKNLAPLKEEEDKVFGKNDSLGAQGQPLSQSGSAATKSDIKPAEKEKAAASTALTLFPLKGLSERKQQEERNKAAAEKAQTEKAAVEKQAQEMQKKAAAGDLVDKIKEQARQHQKSRAAERAEKAERAKQAREQAKAAKAAKAEAKSAKPEANGTKADVNAAKTETKPSAKPAEKQAPAKSEQAPQQIPVQQMPVPQQYMPQQVMYRPVFNPAPKAKTGKGFVPPPPPTLPMSPYGMMPVMPQLIQQQQPRPVVKPKVDKPKAAPKEEAKPEDKPPPMTTTGESADPDFLLDWADPSAKNRTKKKRK